MTTTAPLAPTSPAAPFSRWAVWLTLALVLLADALDLLDATVTNIAAPTIVRDLGGGERLVKWLGAAYALALGTLLVLGGRLGDRFGQRRMFLIGIGGFTLTSLACGLALGPTPLLVARALQGGFGALLIPQGMAIMVRTFPAEALRTAFGLFGPLLGLATVGGPVLAGFLVSANVAGLGWRPIFLINVVLGTFGFVVALLRLPRVARNPAVRIDPLATVLLGLAVFGSMLGLVDGPTDGWDTTAVVAIAVGVACFALFVRRQRTSTAPLLKPSLFANRGFVAGLLVGLVFFAVTTGLAYVLSLFLQQALGLNALHAALALLPLTIGLILASFAGMVLIEKLGRLLVLVGFLLTAAATGGMLALVAVHGPHLTAWTLAPAVFVLGLGMGAGFGSLFNIALGDIDADEAGSASGSMEAVQQLAGGIGSALVTSLYFTTATGTLSGMTLSLAVVLALTAACTPLAALLPRHGHPDLH